MVAVRRSASAPPILRSGADTRPDHVDRLSTCPKPFRGPPYSILHHPSLILPRPTRLTFLSSPSSTLLSRAASHRGNAARSARILQSRSISGSGAFSTRFRVATFGIMNRLDSLAAEEVGSIGNDCNPCYQRPRFGPFCGRIGLRCELGRRTKDETPPRPLRTACLPRR